VTDNVAPIRLAVVGTGAISQVVHVPILAERNDVDLVALADTDAAKADTIARRFDIAEVIELKDALTRDDLDGVVLCTPNQTHEEMAIEALEAGKHVFVERPIATSAEGAGRVIDAARAAGTCLSVGLPHRFRPEVAALRSFVAGGELGEVYSVRGSWLTRQVPLVRATWRQDKAASGGGAMIELGVAAIDLCLWIVGYPVIRSVSCVVHQGDYEVEDAATLMFESEGGIIFSIEVSSRFFAGDDRHYARVMGTEGSGSFPPLEVHKQLGGRPLAVTPRQPRPRGGEDPYTNAYRRQIDQFVRGVSGRSDIGVPEEQVALMHLIGAAYESAEAGHPVVL
jgi:predicted dehydrogenase